MECLTFPKSDASSFADAVQPWADESNHSVQLQGSQHPQMSVFPPPRASDRLWKIGPHHCITIPSYPCQTFCQIDRVPIPLYVSYSFSSHYTNLSRGPDILYLLDTDVSQR